MKLISLILILTTPLAFSAKGPVFVEKGGIVAIEAESTGSSKGRWKVKTDVKDFSGTCHLDFTGNSETNRPPTPPSSIILKSKSPENTNSPFPVALKISTSTAVTPRP